MFIHKQTHIHTNTWCWKWKIWTITIWSSRL